MNKKIEAAIGYIILAISKVRKIFHSACHFCGSLSNKAYRSSVGIYYLPKQPESAVAEQAICAE